MGEHQQPFRRGALLVEKYLLKGGSIMSKGKTNGSGRLDGNVKGPRKSDLLREKSPAGNDERETPPPSKIELPLALLPRFKMREDGKGWELEGEMNLDTALVLSRTFATEAFDVMAHFMNQLAGSLPELSSPADKLNCIVPLLHDLKPRDCMEAMIHLQLIGVHNCIMEGIRRALYPDQTAEVAPILLHRVATLSKAFVGLMEALQKYRGQGSQQKVVVEHVNVRRGGQAIVGAVTQGGPGNKEGVTVEVDAPPPSQARARRKPRKPPGKPVKGQCGARTRRGTACRAPAMKNGRCRMHGGKSTGPKTPEGLEQMRQAKIKHGLYSSEFIDFRRLLNQTFKSARGFLRHLAGTTA